MGVTAAWSRAMTQIQSSSTQSIPTWLNCLKAQQRNSNRDGADGSMVRARVTDYGVNFWQNKQDNSLVSGIELFLVDPCFDVESAFARRHRHDDNIVRSGRVEAWQPSREQPLLIARSVVESEALIST